MKCANCNCPDKVKNGLIKGVQRYKCKSCGYNYTVEERIGKYSKETKRKALQLYLEGLSFRSISRVLGVSDVSVSHWIKGFGKEINNVKSDNKAIKHVELDEMYSYVGTKKNTVMSGLLLIDLQRNSSTSLLVAKESIS